VRYTLKLFYRSEKKKKRNKTHPIYQQKGTNLNKEIQNLQLEEERPYAQKRALIIHIVKKIINLGSSSVNHDIKEAVAQTNLKLKRYTKVDNKALFVLL